MMYFTRRLHLATGPGGRAYLHLAAATVACLVFARFAGALPPLLVLGAIAAGLLRRAAASGADPPAEPASEMSEAYAEDLREEAEAARRRAAMRKMADVIEAQLHAQVGRVGEQAQQMREIADEMARIAERSGENIVCSGMAADSSAEASRALAGSTAEMETAIACIAMQMAEATGTAREAVCAGADVRAAMTQLSSRVGAIASVANRISELARQTNLLALNATIEAARAGEAGRGFAVVAGEVKALARQTAALTSEISQTITTIGQVNVDAARAVEHMEQKISSIEAIAGVISEAVENQRHVTASIAAHVQSNVDASAELSDRVQNLTATMLESLDQTAMVHVKSTSMVESSLQLEEDLRQAITASIRNAAPEASRRLYQRYLVGADQQAAMGFRLSLGGLQQDYTLIDLSDAGCCIATPLPVAAGSKGEVALGQGLVRPFRVASSFQKDGFCVTGLTFTSGTIDALALLGNDAKAA